MLGWLLPRLPQLLLLLLLLLDAWFTMGYPITLLPPPSDAVCLPTPRLTIVCNFCALNLKDYFWLILQQNAARLLAKSERQE